MGQSEVQDSLIYSWQATFVPKLGCQRFCSPTKWWSLLA